MADEQKRLLVIENSVRIRPAQIRALEEAGYIVVRGDPAAFHVIPSEPTPADALALCAALSAIRDNESGDKNSVRWLFGRKLAEQLGYAETVKMK